MGEFSAHNGHLLHNGHYLEPSTRIQLALGLSMSGTEYLAANALRGWAFNYMRTEIFAKKNISAIVSPTVGVLPPEIGEGVFESGESNTPLVMRLMKFIFLGNLLGFPGLSVPVGSSSLLPIGLHLMADHWGESDLIKLST